MQYDLALKVVVQGSSIRWSCPGIRATGIQGSSLCRHFGWRDHGDADGSRLHVKKILAVTKEKADDRLKADLLQHTKRLRTIKRIECLVDTMTASFDQRIINAHGYEVCRLVVTERWSST